MAQLTRHYCTRCERSIYNVEIDGKRIPLVIQMVIGQPTDTGAPLEVNGDGVKLPSFIREIMHLPEGLQRVELCVPCFAEIFGIPCVTAAEDEMWIPPSELPPDSPLRTITPDPEVSRVSAMSALYKRTLHAVEVGRGEKTVADLPVEFQAPKPVEMPKELQDVLRNATPAQRRAMIKRLTSDGVAVAPSDTPTS